MSGFCRNSAVLAAMMVVFCLFAGSSHAQAPLGNEQYAFKIYAVNPAFYPIVQVYLRTWDQEREPLMNVNYMNIGLMVKGRSYDPMKVDPQSRRPQYDIETLQNRGEAFRTVLVLDCSLSMAGKPFADAQNALLRYVEAKRPSDQIAVIAIRDTEQGYQLVSGFQKDPTLLYQLISDVKCDGQRTRLYDSVAAAVELAFTASQGGMSNAMGSEHAVLNTIVVLSDGKDEGSAVARDELMNRIGQLPIPIPIYSLAYAKSDTSSFLNLEALSKGSFGRYWRHADSQEFGATVQHIHRINRSDYVLTFRSYVEVDGGQHALRVGISWPANTGRFVFDNSTFEAMDSPAQYVADTRAIYDQLLRGYPELPDRCPYMDCPAPVTQSVDTTSDSFSAVPVVDTGDVAGGSVAPPPASPGTPEATPVTPAAAQAEESDSSKDAMAFLRENGGLLGLGAGLVAVLIALFAWVKRSGANPAQRTNLTSTDHGNLGRGPSSHARTSEVGGEPASVEKSDTETRF